MAAVDVVVPERVEGHVKLLCEHLDEQHRRLVAGLLSEVVGDGGTKWVAAVTGLDPKTIRQGRLTCRRGWRIAHASGCAAWVAGVAL